MIPLPSAPSASPADADAVLTVRRLSKVYASGHKALDDVSLEIRRGEIFALLGPNGAGKTTLISIVCGLVNPTSGEVRVGGHDIAADYRAARSLIGLVPQELTTDAFETVWNAVSFTRGLFGKRRNPAYIEKLLRDLALWNKKDARIMTLSGGMKRRLLIAKALSHEPKVLFLDEPSAGVDVELRRDMWRMVRQLRRDGVTIILTTHYLEEAEEMADRVGVIDKGRLVVIEEKAKLMRRLGQKQLSIVVAAPLRALPAGLAPLGVTLSEDGRTLSLTYASGADAPQAGPTIAALLARLAQEGVAVSDVSTRESSLEDIFVNLVGGAA